MHARTKARKICTQIIYEWELRQEDIDKIIEDYFSQNDVPQSIHDFAISLAKGIVSYIKDIDKIIEEYTDNWDIQRMTIIDRNILRLGVYEMCFLKSIPPKVSINECVEIGKIMGDIDSPRFINGILDKIYKDRLLNKE